MGVRGRGRTAVAAVVGVVAVAVAAIVVVARAGDDDPAPGGDFAFPEGELLVPADDVREYRLTRVGTTGPQMLDDGAGPLVVASFEGHILAVSSASAEEARERTGDLVPDHRRATVGDRPTVGYGWQLSPFVEREGEEIAWLETDETIFSVASRTLDLDALVALAEQIEADGDGRPSVPGEVIGEIPTMWSAPRPGTVAVFERDEGDFYRRMQVMVVPAGRSTQAAYLALAAPDGAIDGRTVSSCCRSSSPPRRTRDVDGREAIAAPLNAEIHMVILPGDRGAVLLVPGGRFQSVPRDVWLVELARSLRTVPDDELDPFEEALRLPG